MMAMSINVQAQKQGGRLDWQQKIKSEKIAFLTSAMNLSPEEAQIFWPVYNKAEAEKGIAMKAIRQSFKDLADAEKAGKSGKEISSLTKIYKAMIYVTNNTNCCHTFFTWKHAPSLRQSMPSLQGSMRRFFHPRRLPNFSSLRKSSAGCRSGGSTSFAEDLNKNGNLERGLNNKT